MAPVLLLVSLASATPAPPDTALRAFVFDFGQDDIRVPRTQIAALYADACTTGWKPACEAAKWSGPWYSDLTSAAEALQPWCDQGDPLACVVIAWHVGQKTPGEYAATADLDRATRLLEK